MCVLRLWAYLSFAVTFYTEAAIRLGPSYDLRHLIFITLNFISSIAL
jgi:hypothetical protein